ncbi:hypothetical protein TNCV_3145581 [Trichonephila clavipes]|nr:hypothetical protein TNCV_3145581 [Trichonephila clavipes]
MATHSLKSVDLNYVFDAQNRYRIIPARGGKNVKASPEQVVIPSALSFRRNRTSTLSQLRSAFISAIASIEHRRMQVGGQYAKQALLCVYITFRYRREPLKRAGSRVM